ncbi:MAG TPA: hypothetical protein VLX92_06960 [Kofleriaceae bacterium]|nr:hypothetical protein [Kofleriaceae bacterium]
MTKNLLLSLLFVAVTAGVASAGGQAGSIGLGAEYQLSGIGGISVNYDAGRFHVGGFFGYDDPSGPAEYTVDLGARFFYHLHTTAMSDFSLGGSLGFASIPPAAMGGRTSAVFLEPGFQIRVFVASNVALSFTGGFSIGLADVSGFAITSQAVGIAGIHYYFF